MSYCYTENLLFLTFFCKSLVFLLKTKPFFQNFSPHVLFQDFQRFRKTKKKKIDSGFRDQHEGRDSEKNVHQRMQTSFGIYHLSMVFKINLSSCASYAS